jgi:hypothetical protein
MTVDVEALYALLPAVYRIRDANLAQQSGGIGPLKALLGVLADEFAQIDDNIDQLYDDLFIETCANWVVPYIGDAIGVRGVVALVGSRFSERAFVANTMRYRRRKGTASVLEQLARDVTGWSARAVEFFELLATTQYMNHLRLPGPGAAGNLSFASIRDAVGLEAIGTPFDRVTRTADVRRIEPRRGRYNIPNVGIFLYRLWSYTVTDAPAYAVDPLRYQFDTLGTNIQLFSDPVPETEISHLAEPVNVSAPLTRRALSRDVKNSGGSLFYGVGKSLSLAIDGAPVDRQRITICDLSDSGTGWAHTPPADIAIDPVLGRIALAAAASPLRNLRVSYAYGFSDDIGGGDYERTASFTLSDLPNLVAAAGLPAALNQVASQGGVVQITDNDYCVGALAIARTSGARRQIEVRAAPQRRPTVVLQGDWTISAEDTAEVTINGLLVSGTIRVPAVTASGAPNSLAKLRLQHCTLAPGSRPPIFGLPARNADPVLIVEAPDVRIEIEDCIVGAVRAVDNARVSIVSSIVDAAGERNAAYSGLTDALPGAPLEIQRSTVVGKVWTLTMTLASNTIFLADLRPDDPWPAPVRAARLQQGCTRFSYVPPGSWLPRLYHCQPESGADAARVRPVFVSLRYGDAAYGQLSAHCAAEIRRGADDGGEMGAFHDLYQPQREANVRTSLDEYLRFGLEAGIFFAT